MIPDPNVMKLFSLFRPLKKIPPFLHLQQYSSRDLYFRRIASWDIGSNNEVIVIDPKQPRLLTLDPWPEMIFISADGQRTVAEYVLYAAEKYTGTVPDLLDKTIIDEIENLLQYGIIQLTAIRSRPDIANDKPGGV